MCASVATASVPSPRHVAAAGDVLKRPHAYAANRICARGQRNLRSAEVTRVAQGARDGVLGPAFLALRGLVARSRRVDGHARSRCVGVALGDVLAPVVFPVEHRYVDERLRQSTECKVRFKRKKTGGVRRYSSSKRRKERKNK